MELSFLFIKILAVYFVISGLFLLMKGKTLPFILKDFFNHPAIVFLTGVILIFLGSAILIQNYTSVFENNVQILATFFGWVVLLKGITYLFIPKKLEKISYKKFDSWFGVMGVVTLIIGIVLFVAI